MALALHIAFAMRIKSLLVTLGILGSSSLTLADHRGFDGRWERRQRASYTYQQPRTWQALSPQQRLDGRNDVFDVRARQRFAQLRLQNQTGRTFVKQIEIVFGNGERQCVEVNRVLDGNHAMVNIDLSGEARRIDAILVDGRSRNGSYQLYAM